MNRLAVVPIDFRSGIYITYCHTSMLNSKANTFRAAAVSNDSLPVASIPNSLDFACCGFTYRNGSLSAHSLNEHVTMDTTSYHPAESIVPPFTQVTAQRKVRLAEDAWNSRDPHRVALAYSEDSVWRNRNVFVTGRAEIRQFLTGKWERELDYRLVKDLWAFSDNRIAVRFQYEWHDSNGQWHRSYGNELWEFDHAGLMRRREASINDLVITESDRRFFWPSPGPRPADHAGIPGVS